MTHIYSYWLWLTDHLISARRPDLIIINIKKGICKIVDSAVPADHRIKLKESEKRISTSTLLGIEKTMEHAGDNYNNRDWCFWYIPQRIIKGTGGLDNRRTSEDIQATTLLRTVRILIKVSRTFIRLAVT